MVCCKAEFEKKPEYLEDLPEKIKSYSKFLRKQPPWFARDEMTFVDFLNYDSLHQQHTVELKCLDMFPSLKDLLPCLRFCRISLPIWHLAASFQGFCIRRQPYGVTSSGTL